MFAKPDDMYKQAEKKLQKDEAREIEMKFETNNRFLKRVDVAEYYDRSTRWVSAAFKNGTIPPPINKNGSPRWTLRILEAHTAARENAVLKSVEEN